MAANVQKVDLVDIELNSGNIHRSWMKQSIGSADVKGNAFGVRVFRDGEGVTLSSVSVYGYFRDSHGNNIAITTGNTVSGNVAYVVLPAACYNYEGQFCLAIKLIGGGVTGTMRIVDGMVDNTHTGGAVAPTAAVPSYSEILETYDEMVAATAVANEAIAPEYDDLTFPVAAGTLCIYNGALYQASVAISTSEVWTPAHWTETTFGDRLRVEALARVSGDADVLQQIAPVFQKSSANNPGTYVTYEGALYYLPNGHTANAEWADTTKTAIKIGSALSTETLARASGDADVLLQIAPAFQKTSANAAGTYVTYEGALYYLPNGHTANAEWADTTKTAVKIANEVSSVKSAISLIIDGINNDGLIEPTLIWQTGKYISKTDNTITSGNSQLYISNYIPIPSGTNKIEIYKVVNFANGWTVAFYDENKGFISGEFKTTTYAQSQVFSLSTIPSNAKYFVIGHYDYNNQYPVSNVSAIIYFLDGIVEIVNDIDDLKEDSIKIGFDESYENILAGASTFTDSKFVNDRGDVVNNPYFCLIDGYFPVKPSTVYKLYRGEPSLYSNSGHNWTFWDENKSFISYTLSGSAVTSPVNARFLRLGIYISNTGSATHENFDPTNVIVTEDAKPCFDNIFTSLVSRPVFSGMKWIGIGDSITEENFRATYHYHDYIKAETGLSFVNMGVSGTGYKAEGSGDKAFYKRVPNMATDADLITIFGGVNDVVLSNATIGTASDTGTDTICGCVNETIDEIEELYPAHMPIGIISPLPCYCSDTSVNLHPYQKPDDETNRMSQFVEQLFLICKHRGIPFLDLFHQSNLRPWHSECNAKYFSCDSAPTGDGLHPNGHGHRLFYRQILEFIKGIISG